MQDKMARFDRVQRVGGHAIGRRRGAARRRGDPVAGDISQGSGCRDAIRGKQAQQSLNAAGEDERQNHQPAGGVVTEIRLSFALATYVCEAGREAEELADCEQIIGSLIFVAR